MATFYDQIGQNKRNSVLLAVLVIVILGLLGLFIGWAVTGDPRAALPSVAIAITVGLVASLISYYAGSAAKNSRLVNPNMPAMNTAGTVWIAVL